MALRWADVDFARGRVTVRSPKTEHHDGKEQRVMPLFPELRAELDALRSSLPLPLPEFVVRQYRRGSVNSNLRTRLTAIVKAAGFVPWPKLFQNLRLTRQTELTRRFGAKAACDWIGNSEKVADAHYIQAMEADFAAAIAEGSSPTPVPTVRHDQKQSEETGASKNPEKIDIPPGI